MVEKARDPTFALTFYNSICFIVIDFGHGNFETNKYSQVKYL